ncbi:MAG TPA: cyclic nucleotide-binding domain-containing protein [Allosphingosinicella sp.]|nr:cyclic nucleotide-binding domain-containing protein [Allosphingosinicella sp.]
MVWLTGLLLHLGFFLLAVAVLVKRPILARSLVGGAAFAWLVRSALLGDWIVALWGGLIAGLALIVVGRRLWRDSAVRFTPDEQHMMDTLFDGLPRSRARHLVDQGVWISGKAGDTLTREGEPVEHLYYLAEGDAQVLSKGVEVGQCHAGDLIGELTVLSGETATATVVLTRPSRFWCAPAEDLRPYVETHEDIRRAIEHGFATVLKAKLRASNRTIAEAAGARD